MILSGGLRYDHVTNKGQLYDQVTNTPGDQKDKAWTPQAGLVWHASEQVSLYGNYSESFLPSIAQDINGDPLEPEVGEGLELGMRVQPEDNRFQISASAFQVTKENIATADPNDPAFPFGASIATGRQRSRGLELELNGNLAPGLQAIAGLGLVRTKVLEDNTDVEGNAFIRVPEVTADLWVTYELPQGLGLGAGVNYVGKRWVDTANTISIAPHTLLNASVYYSRNGWRFDMVLHNLTNQKYVSSAWGGTGRSVHPRQTLRSHLDNRLRILVYQFWHSILECQNFHFKSETTNGRHQKTSWQFPVGLLHMRPGVLLSQSYCPLSLQQSPARHSRFCFCVVPMVLSFRSFCYGQRYGLPRFFTAFLTPRSSASG